MLLVEASEFRLGFSLFGGWVGGDPMILCSDVLCRHNGFDFSFLSGIEQEEFF